MFLYLHNIVSLLQVVQYYTKVNIPTVISTKTGVKCIHLHSMLINFNIHYVVKDIELHKQRLLFEFLFNCDCNTQTCYVLILDKNRV